MNLRMTFLLTTLLMSASSEVVTESITTAVIIGIVCGIIVLAALIFQMRSVKTQKTANDYICDGSLNITEQGEFFLYSTVDRVRKDNDD